MTWPNDADGGVLRSLQADSFDFGQPHVIDFNVDFESWPPAPAAVALLRSMYGAVKLFPPGELGLGYVEFQVTALVSYELVTSVQRNATKAMEPFGGICESWGLMHHAA